MGYDVHLVKKGDWFDTEDKFTEEDWEVLQKEMPASDWLYFDNGSITVKSPTQEQVAELARIAKSHNWSVQGDDGERYDEGGLPIAEPPEPPARPGFIRALLNPIQEFRAKRAIQRSMKGTVCPFEVGDKVRTPFRAGGVVIEVDEKGNHGLGSIKVRFPDGTVLGGLFVNHGFEKEL